MTTDEYIVNVKRTESPNFQPVDSRLLHGAIGCCTEAGELLDAVKKALFYNRRMDETNLKEEVGDLLWYIALVIDSQGWTFEDVMDRNIQKLRIRYPEQFSEQAEQDRDYNKEATVLQDNP